MRDKKSQFHFNEASFNQKPQFKFKENSYPFREETESRVETRIQSALHDYL